ncbi:hypothetical protein NDU88_003859 [Pleurodeles waltl]|uniref:Uncharacterized protein n=1 Tax=Pleurodeles waltl TaxID=8319 RepID=A0AAV7PAS5_PLEWA|nr:hypothetical protein NDU88_003859 [Pleurodeles waltl]
MGAMHAIPGVLSGRWRRRHKWSPNPTRDKPNSTMHRSNALRRGLMRGCSGQALEQKRSREQDGVRIDGCWPQPLDAMRMDAVSVKIRCGGGSVRAELCAVYAATRPPHPLHVEAVGLLGRRSEESLSRT